VLRHFLVLLLELPLPEWSAASMALAVGPEQRFVRKGPDRPFPFRNAPFV